MTEIYYLFCCTHFATLKGQLMFFFLFFPSRSHEKCALHLRQFCSQLVSLSLYFFTSKSPCITVTSTPRSPRQARRIVRFTSNLKRQPTTPAAPSRYVTARKHLECYRSLQRVWRRCGIVWVKAIQRVVPILY